MPDVIPIRPDLLIRPARVEERDALVSLQWRASLGNPGDRDALLANPDMIAIPDSQFQDGLVFVADVAARLAGFSALLPRPDGGMDLDGLFVEPGEQRCGVGRRLVEHAVALARARGATALHVIGNPHADAFYCATGFERVGTCETSFGPATLLRRRIDVR